MAMKRTNVQSTPAPAATALRQHIDVAVIGAGVLGMSVTDVLMRGGTDVVCFEGRAPGQGQSGGLSRTFRHRHDDHQAVELAVESRGGWREWERRSGSTLLGPEGTLYLGMEEADAEGMRTHGVAHRFADPTEQSGLFGPLEQVGTPLLTDPDSGAIRARDTIEALAGWVSPRVRTAEVHSVTVPEDGQGVEIQTAESIFRARHVLICAGAATPRLAAGVGLDIPLSCSLHARPHFRVRPDYVDTPLPCWVDRSGVFGETVYGSPIGSTGYYVFGLIGDGVDIPFEDGALPAGAEMEEHVRRVSDYVRRAMPGMDPEPTGVRVCVMSKLPGGSDAFGVWQTDGVTAVTGHNMFKLAPVLGHLLAQAATEERLPDELVGFGQSQLAAPIQ